MKKILYSLAIVTGFVVLFTIVYLASTRSTVTAPTKEPQASGAIAKPTSTPADFKDNEDALKNALNLYIKNKQEGLDMVNGPCLGKVADDWVLDIAHKPRQKIDDDPKNQCADFREGRVHHFIELDENGKLINFQ
ncbi:MAG: hypothetical protein AAB512_04505 [Patescibacteria group bacterium]